VPEVEW